MILNADDEGRDLQTREASECDASEYASPNGLLFDTRCDQRIGDTDAYWTGMESRTVDSLEHCMNWCAIARPPCGTVTYGNNRCIFYTGVGLLSHANSTERYEIGIAQASQLRAPGDLSCPYGQSSIQTTKAGEQFEILCDADFMGDGGDYCPLNQLPWECPAHADNLDECLELCSQAHPLCKGVSWNPDMKQGYGNCYLKTSPTGSRPVVPADLGLDFVVHSAQVTQSFFYDIDTLCPRASPYAAPDGTNSTIHCFDGRTGTQNITSVHENSLDQCLDSCTSYTDQKCLGVVFDMGMSDGYENCYLLNATGSPRTGLNMTFAELTQSSREGTISSQSDSAGKSSKAWIAGPVIGIVAFLAILAGGILWWRQRRSQERHMQEMGTAEKRVEMAPSEDRLTQEMGTTEKRVEMAPNEGRLPRKDAVKGPRYELVDPNSERLYQHEMQS